MTTRRMPALFVCHGGGPMPLLPKPNHHEDLIALWKRHREELFPTEDSLPKAIVLVSAHYEEETMKVGGAAAPGMLYDYGGFPPETYKVQYPAPGNTELAKRIVDQINSSVSSSSSSSAGAHAKSMTATLDPKRPFDHGVFIPLMFLFPEANIPVIPISVLQNQDVATHIAVGKALSSLRDEGVFILGSGSSSHNMSIRTGQNVGKDFNERLASTLVHSDKNNLKGAELTKELATYLEWPGAREAQVKGYAEHLMPLFTVLGTSNSLYPPESGSEAAKQAAPVQVDFSSLMSWVVADFTFLD